MATARDAVPPALAPGPTHTPTFSQARARLSSAQPPGNSRSYLRPLIALALLLVAVYVGYRSRAQVNSTSSLDADEYPHLMPADMDLIRRKAGVISRYVSQRHAALGAGELSRPLVLSLQGPQGSGKSTVVAQTVKTLADKYNLTCAVASTDDFYLTHEGLAAVAAANPTNPIMKGRGPPGTHDLKLLSSVLSSLRASQPSSRAPVRLPLFDKSLFDGEGDRSAQTVDLAAPLDVFILEGWSLGFAPVPDSVARQRWRKGRVASGHPFENIQTLNANLGEVEDAIGDKFDAHIAIKPQASGYEVVYDWRLQAEHAMKEKNGGRGMSDEAVKKFVGRYMPVYEVFGENEVQRPTLALRFGPERELLGAETRETNSQGWEPLDVRAKL